MPEPASRSVVAWTEPARFERQMVLVRWLAVGLAVPTAWFGYRTSAQAHPPASIRTSALAVLGVLALGNLLIMAALRPGPPPRVLARIGFAAAALDAGCVFFAVWLYAFDPVSVTWIVIFLLLVEGAFRWGTRGAAAVFALAALLEPLRYVYGSHIHGGPVVVTNLVFELGVLAAVGLIVGLVVERAGAERRASEKRAAELEIFNEVILAGAGGRTIEETVQFSATEMAYALGYEHLAIRLIDRDVEPPVLRIVATVGFPPGAIGSALALHQGVAGTAAATGRGHIVRDTTVEPGYVEFVPGARSQLAMPIRARGEVIGVVDVVSKEVDAFTQDDVGRLWRLAPQIGLILSNATLLAREQEAVERLHDLDQMKSDFIGIASHELRTPLTTLKGFLRTLRRPELQLSPEQIDDFYLTMDHKVDRLTRLVEDLLIASRVDSGHMAATPEDVRIGDLIAEVLRELGSDASRIELELAPGVGRMYVDGQRLLQIVRNLAENALKFSDVPVTLRVQRDGDDVTFEVVDHGPGIPEDLRPTVFERFTQLGGSRDRRSSGVGLGLYIVKAFVDLLGGTIVVRESDGGGATFLVRLPSGIEEAPRRVAFGAGNTR